jgi:hypothetical protein
VALGHIKALPTKEAADTTTKALLPRGSNRSTANTAGVETTAKTTLLLLGHTEATPEATTKATLLLLPGHNMWPRHITKATLLLTAKATTKALLLGHLVKALTTKTTTKAALLLLTAEAASHW